MTADSCLRCAVCGRESTTNFASSLRDGWERCCGYTMTLVSTDADIDRAVGDAFEERALKSPGAFSASHPRESLQ